MVTAPSPTCYDLRVGTQAKIVYMPFGVKKDSRCLKSSRSDDDFGLPTVRAFACDRLTATTFGAMILWPIKRKMEDRFEF